MTETPIVMYGVVKDKNGNPVSQARVSFVAGPVPLPDIAALTNDDGKFVLSMPVAGEYVIEVISDEFIKKSVKIKAESGSKKNIEVNLSKK